MSDGTDIIGTITSFNINNYYGGNPLNPRFIQPGLFNDNAHTFDQELRLVSKTGPGTPFDYVVGLFYEDQTRVGGWYNPNPGSPERAVAQGCTAPYYAGASFPDCLLSTGPGMRTSCRWIRRDFTDKSEFGELTYHFTEQRPDHRRLPAFRAGVHRLPIVPGVHVRPADPSVAAQRTRLEEHLEGQPFVRVRAGPVRLCDLVAGFPPRRRKLGAAGGYLQRKPAAHELCAGFGQQL